MEAEEKIEKALIKASIFLPTLIKEKLKEASENEKGRGSVALAAICENINIAEKKGIPLCQDTGMFWCLASIGKESNVKLKRVEEVINEGCRRAVFNTPMRRSIVRDPVYKRENTNDNLPAVIHYEIKEGEGLTLRFLLKGFGCENCSGVKMLSPTSGEEGVRKTVCEFVREAGGRPCPPITLGIGIGGTIDRAALLSKKAFFENGDENLSSLILQDVNSLGIGAGALGGQNTALSVSVLTEPSHIASLPVAVTISCWAERRAEISFEEGEI